MGARLTGTLAAAALALVAAGSSAAAQGVPPPYGAQPQYGAPPQYARALRAYNDSGLYVDAVTRYAREIAANPYALYYLYCWRP